VVLVTPASTSEVLGWLAGMVWVEEVTAAAVSSEPRDIFCNALFTASAAAAAAWRVTDKLPQVLHGVVVGITRVLQCRNVQLHKRFQLMHSTSAASAVVLCSVSLKII